MKMARTNTRHSQEEDLSRLDERLGLSRPRPVLVRIMGRKIGCRIKVHATGTIHAWWRALQVNLGILRPSWSNHESDHD